MPLAPIMDGDRHLPASIVAGGITTGSGPGGVQLLESLVHGRLRVPVRLRGFLPSCAYLSTEIPVMVLSR